MSVLNVLGEMGASTAIQDKQLKLAAFPLLWSIFKYKTSSMELLTVHYMLISCNCFKAEAFHIFSLLVTYARVSMRNEVQTRIR